MSEETGAAPDAARARETALAQGVRAPVEADRVVVPTLRAAYRTALGEGSNSMPSEPRSRAPSRISGRWRWAHRPAEECPSGLDLRSPNPEAYEITGQREGEYVFVLNYLGHVRAVVGQCVVEIMPMAIGRESTSEVIDLSKLADVALDIGRTVGCSAYQNDFTLPHVPEEWRNQPVGWYTEGLPPYIPGLSDPKE